ncbi:MAG: HipA domain-containing protein [Bacteroidetes bacterium]|nr:HipA domain-containing protein [Bacteroidota bacterium]MCH8525052.1 HipA domain-containing protein [Balneolales bacterium]
MASDKTDIIVFAHWKGMPDPIKMGVLTAQEARGHLAWSFAYEKEWLDTQSQIQLDPDLEWFTGPQYSKDNKPNYGMFLDSMPDTWGRTLMKKREALLKPKGQPRRKLTDIDFLLGVFDPARMGGLRFKLDEEGPFLDNDEEKSIPPITDVRELQVGADLVESDEGSEAVRKWLQILLAPGSSLGGARPKSSVMDENDELWIAKFPSREDTTDKGAWEYIAWELAKLAGIRVPEARVEQVAGKYHTFFSKRFDRSGKERIHFASAMTMTGHLETGIRDYTPSYLELAEFIQYNGASPDEDLHELWRRIVFNIATSNTDDHLRNHGFVITEEGWRLSPAYDMNPSIDKAGLALNIDLELNALDYDLARSVGEYFNLEGKEMDTIIDEVKEAVSKWDDLALKIGIPSAQRRLMEAAFNLK